MALTDTQQTTLRRVPFPCSSGEAGGTLDISRDAAYHRLAVLRDKGYVTLDGDNVWHRRDADIPDEDETKPTEAADEDADDPEGVPDGVASALHSGLTYDEFETEFDLSQSAARRVMEEMRQEGYTIDFKTVDDKGTRLFFIPDEHDKRFQVGDGDGRYQFAVISDTHLGSRAEHLDELHDFYDRVQARGIDLVFHAGDIGDGWEVHPGHINEIKGEASGWERLLKYVVDNYPSREGVDTLFIEGNHDHKLHRRTGVRFGKRIDEQRDDLHYCGDSMARFVFDPENDIDLELIHPSGGQPYCYDGQTKVLTERHGYVRLDEFKPHLESHPTTRVATFDTDTGAMEFQQPAKVAQIPYEGEMVKFDGQGLDLLVTPNHRMVVRKNESYHGKAYDWKIEEASHLQENYTRQKWDVPKVGSWNGDEPPETIRLEADHHNANPVETPTKPFLRFLGWYIAEGYTYDPGRIHLSQTTRQDELVDVFDAIGISAHVYDDKIKATNKALAAWLEEHVGVGAENKRIPTWAKRLPPEYLEILLESLFDGDGHRSDGKLKGYTSASEQLADDVVECLLKTGRSAGVKKRDREYEFNGYAGETTTYEVYVGHTKRGTEPSICTEPTTVDFDGAVYCLAVPNETLFVRRNGKTAISGNTVGYRLQTLFRERPLDKRPSIAAVGHLHGSMYAHTEGVRGFYAGAWKGLTTYGKRKGHEASVGGWILTLEIEGGEIRSLTPEWIGYSSDDSTANFSLEDISDLVAGE